MATWYKINASAKLTVRADSLNVRSGPQLYDFVKSVKAGEVVQATDIVVQLSRQKSKLFIMN